MMNPDPIKELEEQLIPYELQPWFSWFYFSYQSKVAWWRAKHKWRVANTKLMIQDLEWKTVSMLNIKPSQPINM